MEKTYKVVFRGVLQKGFEPPEVVQNLQKALGWPEEKAVTFVNSTKEIAVKQGVDRETAEAIGRKMAQLGLRLSLVEMGSQLQSAVSPASSLSLDTIRNKMRERTSASAHANPYAAPEADLDPDDFGEPDDFGDPAKRPAGHGWRWIMEAFHIFKSRPFAYLGAMLVMGLVYGIFSIIPFVNFFTMLLLPVLMGGFMLGLHEHEEGGQFRVKHVFAGFSHNRNQLLLLGFLITLAMLAAFIPFFLVFGVSAFIGMGGAEPEAITGAGIMMTLLASLIGLALMIPVYMGMWFSPALVAINDYTAWEAVKTSFIACKRNILPFLVYGLVFMGVGLLFWAILGVAAAVAIPLFVGGGDEAGVLAIILPVIMMILGFLFMLPFMSITTISVYTAYRDIFYS